MNKVYSTDEENYYHEFPSDIEVGDVYYEADLVPDSPENYIKNNHIEHFLSWLDEDLVSQYDEPKDSDYCFTNIPETAFNELRSMIISWACKNVSIKSAMIKNVIEKVAIKEDI